MISYLMTGHRSVYPSQVLAIAKSSSFEVELGKEIEGVEASYQPRRKTLIGGMLALGRWVREKFSNVFRPSR